VQLFCSNSDESNFAQALIALGRAGEGDPLLAEIARRTWHDQWSSVAEQARELLARGKPAPR
jgi:hypothetical protein